MHSISDYSDARTYEQVALEQRLEIPTFMRMTCCAQCGLELPDQNHDHVCPGKKPKAVEPDEGDIAIEERHDREIAYGHAFNDMLDQIAESGRN